MLCQQLQFTKKSNNILIFNVKTYKKNLTMEYKVATVLNSLNVKGKLMFILRVRGDTVTSCEQSSLSGDNESLWTLVIHAAAMFTLDAKISDFPTTLKVNVRQLLKSAYQFWVWFRCARERLSESLNYFKHLRQLLIIAAVFKKASALYGEECVIILWIEK